VQEFVEETLGGDAEILVAFWDGKETVLEEGEGRRTGEGFEEGEIADGLKGGGPRAWTKR
jgi:hypothetical protein